MDRHVKQLERSSIAARRLSKTGDQVQLPIQIDAERIDSVDRVATHVARVVGDMRVRWHTVSRIMRAAVLALPLVWPASPLGRADRLLWKSDTDE